MPARLLREGILSSDRVDQLDAAAEVFYRRLMSKVDDHGLYDARPAILRSSLYPLRVDRVREADISRWIAACEKAGLIALYAHDGKPYLQMLDTRWTARSEPKFPLPTIENKCAQLQTCATLDVFGDGDVVEDGKARKRAAFDPKEIELPADISRESWALWCEDRAARKKPITERGAQMQLQKLVEYRQQGYSAKEVIEHSIAGGYQGLFAPSRKPAQLQTTAHSGQADETQRYLREQAEHKRAAPPPEILARIGKAVKVPQ
jgi:hypothetical protein